jgi:DNA-binding Lrp family transcriptional regulator
MRKWTIDDARRECGAVEEWLKKGFDPSPSGPKKGAVRLAAEQLKEPRSSFEARVGVPNTPGMYHRQFGISPDWSFYKGKDFEELVRESIEAYHDADGNFAQAAKNLGVSPSTVRNRIKNAARTGLISRKPVMPGFEIRQTSTQLDGNGNVEREWVKQVPESAEPFEVPAGHVIKGISALTDETGRVRAQWIKTRDDPENVIAQINAVVDELKKSIPREKPVSAPKYTDEKLLNQFTVTDLHFGMLAWAEETGDADYDLKIAEKLLIDWFNTAIAMSPRAEVGVLAQLGDLMHHDSMESVTPTNRNVLDADSRLQKIIRVVIRVVRQIISMLLQHHSHVHVIMATANHDPASSAWLRELLHSFYENEPRITVDNSPDTYYAYKWGDTGLFYHHGHKRKISDVDRTFAGKFKEIYGSCTKSYGHLGHLHNDETVESPLMKVERHRTLAPRDAYASSHGWLSDSDAKVITYHKEFGEVFRSTLSPQMLAKA